VRVFVTEDLLHRGVWRAWLVLAVLGTALVLLAIAVADRLGRAVVRPVADLAHAARQLGRGDLAVRVSPTGPPEIVEVGRAFNRLAVRIADLLAQERELVADLSHRLRTPLTALALDAEGVRDPEMARRLSDDVAEVERVIDRIIAEARRPMRQGVGITADLGEVVRGRVEFWSALADEQGRRWALQVAPGPHPVPVHPDDLEAAIDAIIGNVFAHTDEQVGFRVAVVGPPGGPTLLILDDNGAGFSRNGDGITALVERGVSGGGSSGLGLDIARRTAESAGGRLRLANRNTGGARVEMEFPAPQH
jgi:signal transduction histidine kinase